MARSVPLVSTIFVLLLLLVAAEVGPTAARVRTCQYPSRRSVPVPCRRKPCVSACRSEGFPAGYCGGLGRSRCLCRKPC